MDEQGCLRFNPIAALPDALTGGWLPGDERFDLITARRPLVEAIVARLVASSPGVSVRRSAAVTELLADHEGRVPHVRGVRTSTDGEITADVVVDAAGRRSPLGDLLVAAGCRRPAEEIDDVGYVYYSRDFHNRDGSLPPLVAPLSQFYGSYNIATLPADQGRWSVVLVASSADRAMRRAADVDVWERMIDAHPAARHWAAADERSDVVTFRRIEDRRRCLVVDGAPVATGVLSVGDAWACTNPSVGRGVAIGAMHAVALRDHLREPADPTSMTFDWSARTAEVVEPYWVDTHAFDTHRLRQIEAAIDGRSYDTDDPAWLLGRALAASAAVDPTMLRHLLDVTTVLSRGREVLARPGVAARAIELAPTAVALPSPDRDQLVELLGATSVAA